MRTEFVLFDTSVMIDLWRSGKHRESVESLRGIVCVSTVVLAELWRGVTAPAESRTLETLQKNHRVLAPTENNWVESGKLLAKMRSQQGFESTKLRDLHFDVLIALTARSHGACLITSNRSDFELIRTYRDFDLEIW